MASKTFQALAIALAVALVALVSFTAGATSGSAGPAGDDRPPSFVQQLHAMASRLHGAAGHGHGHGHDGSGGVAHPMGQLVEQLGLSPEQTERLEAIHRALQSYGGRADGSIVELHEDLVARFEQGRIEPEAVREMIDRHLAEIRHVAYAVTDDLLALVNSLDAEQRELVLAHVQQVHGSPGH